MLSTINFKRTSQYCIKGKIKERGGAYIVAGLMGANIRPVERPRNRALNGACCNGIRHEATPQYRKELYSRVPNQLPRVENLSYGTRGADKYISAILLVASKLE